MVNNPRRQRWVPPPNPLPVKEASRRIAGGPIYDLGVVQQLLSTATFDMFAATDTCDEWLLKLEWDLDDVAGLIAILQAKDYRNSEWCYCKGRVAIDADVYVVRYDHINECRGTYSHAEYYLKYGFRNNDPRLTLWLIQCHLSRP